MSESTDVLVLDRGCPVAVLLESKLRMLRSAGFFGASPEKLVANLREYAEPILQVLKFLQSLDHASQKGVLTKRGKVIWKEIQRTRDVVICIAVPSMPVPITGRDYREHVDSALELAVVSDAGLSAFMSRFEDAHRVMWAVADAEDLSMLAGWSTSRRIGRTLVQYVRATAEGASVTTRGPQPDVADFANELGRDVHVAEYVQRVFESACDHASELAFGTSAS